MHMGIVFKPKIGEHLRKSEGYRSDKYSEEELETIVQLRANGVTYKACGESIGKPVGSIANMISYHDLQYRIDKAIKLRGLGL